MAKPSSPNGLRARRRRRRVRRRALTIPCSLKKMLASSYQAESKTRRRQPGPLQIGHSVPFRRSPVDAQGDERARDPSVAQRRLQQTRGATIVNNSPGTRSLSLQAELRDTHTGRQPHLGRRRDAMNHIAVAELTGSDAQRMTTTTSTAPSAPRSAASATEPRSAACIWSGGPAGPHPEQQLRCSGRASAAGTAKVTKADWDLLCAVGVGPQLRPEIAARRGRHCRRSPGPRLAPPARHRLTPPRESHEHRRNSSALQQALDESAFGAWLPPLCRQRLQHCAETDIFTYGSGYENADFSAARHIRAAVPGPRHQ